MTRFATRTFVAEAGLGDAPALAELHAAAFRRGWSAEEMEALLVGTGVFALLARRRSVLALLSRPVGFVLVRAIGDEAEVLTIAVADGYRRRGVGRALMDEALRRLYAARVRSVFLEVDAGNAPAAGLYRRLGFAEVGTRQGYYAAGAEKPRAALVMRARLG